jgi:two-component system NtrC family sensor kinase
MWNRFIRLIFSFHQSLTLKLSFSMGLVTLAAIGLFAYHIIETEKRQGIEQVVDEANRFSEALVRSTKWSMLHYQTESLQHIINSVGEQQGIEKLRIFNKDGLIMYSKDPGEVGQMVDMKAEACYACHAVDQPLVRLPIKARTRFFESRGERLVGMINPIYNERACWTAPCHAHEETRKVLGVLDIGLSLTSLETRIDQNIRWTILFAVSVFLGISTLLGLYLYFFVKRPIKMVVDGAEAMARGERAEPIMIRTGDELSHMARSFNEMREQVRLREMALLQSERLAAIGTTVASLAHNIKNILNGLEGGVYVVNAGMEDGNEENLRKGWDMVQRNVLRISDLAHDLLTYAKDRKPVLSHVSLNEIVAEVREDVAPLAEKHDVRIETDLDPSLGVVWLDREGMYRAVLNLVNNGVDAGAALDGRQGKVTVRTRRMGPHQVRIEIRDNGVGMDREVQQKIFTTFFSTKGAKGTGLGLLAAQKVVHEHGGRIMAASDVGQGTTFTIFLPDRPPSPENGPPANG